MLSPPTSSGAHPLPHWAALANQARQAILASTTDSIKASRAAVSTQEQPPAIMPSPYLWIVIASGVLSFLTGGGVGMNDLANAFGTTYGARIMKLWQIVLLASICEFVGAVALGAEVTSTISNGIANPQSFADEPYILMYGMMCALAAAFMWLMFATLMELPVSSTHSIAGAIMGFVMVYGGPKAVSFAKRIDTFPFVAGVAPIIASWFISPGFSGVAAATLYGTVRCIVLRADKPVRRAMYFLPVIVGITFFLESFFVLYKGAKARLHWSAGKAAWVSAIVGCCASIVTTALLPFLSRRVRWLWERRQRDGMSAAEAPGCVKESPEPVPETLVREPAMCPMTSPPPESGADGGGIL
ncbi:phosphate-repressible phosphate permease, putative [Trypanosoma vivax Y486]|uniref:Phosphate-repressible phosphate permease, putative n=1 Tax=Trypanosoma vivax (strain Y486) TaxID=1055687 RepID=F9WQ84_TRYVY|nr:phosphate-repressible phosphate permease, putative [Trypanosoma vivax Y486]|eukprot:CCD19711.1 phosphate-repressible phosphate permease, putative [Trypanosoma vivax Y486]